MAKLQTIQVELTDGQSPRVEVRVKTPGGTATASYRVETFDISPAAQTRLGYAILQAIVQACGAR